MNRAEANHMRPLMVIGYVVGAAALAARAAAACRESRSAERVALRLDPGKRGEHDPVGPGQARSGIRPV